ncbi:MAG TPA: M20/M25/M40 family metallo-hydrolase [Gemmatimonadales bacterium]|nr:M20/M25/M40 family metallo-hydrolase [Gemmatimonadales bacterium]
MPSFLHTLLDSPGPSGFETAPARLWRKEAESFADDVHGDVHGNSYASLFAGEEGSRVAGRKSRLKSRGVTGRGTGASETRDLRPATSIMFAGHIDEIGLMVVHIDDNGFLTFDGIGGWDTQVFVGQRVTILGRKGPVAGVIGKKAIHLMDKDDRDKVSKTEDLWIDIGARKKAEAEKLVRVGDAGVLTSKVEELPNGRIVSRALDNRVGAYVVLEALRLLANGKSRATRRPPLVNVTAVATTQEEISYTGGGARTSATTLDATVAIAVDVTHATDYPGIEKRKHGDFRLGGGPVLSRGSAVNPAVFDLLVAAAEREKIPYTVEAAPRATHTDADNIFTAHRGVATGLVSVPLRYMHSPNEMVAVEDLERAARLLAAFAQSVGPETSWVPR